MMAGLHIAQPVRHREQSAKPVRLAEAQGVSLNSPGHARLMAGRAALKAAYECGALSAVRPPQLILPLIRTR